MALSLRKFTKELKVAAIQRLDAGASVAELARAFEVNPNLLHRWRKEFRHGPGKAFPEGGKRHWDETKVAQLERKVGLQTVEIDFLKGCLQRRPRAKDEGRPYPWTKTPARLRFWSEEERMLHPLTGNPRRAGESKVKSRRVSR